MSVLGITLSSSRTTDNVIEKAVMKFNMKSNEVISDFNLLTCYIKSKLFTTYCADPYGCQLWKFESREEHHLYVAWRKVVRNFDNINNELRNVHNWLLAQRLSLNVSKTKLMMFHNKKMFILGNYQYAT